MFWRWWIWPLSITFNNASNTGCSWGKSGSFFFVFPPHLSPSLHTCPPFMCQKRSLIKPSLMKTHWGSSTNPLRHFIVRRRAWGKSCTVGTIKRRLYQGQNISMEIYVNVYNYCWKWLLVLLLCQQKCVCMCVCVDFYITICIPCLCSCLSLCKVIRGEQWVKQRHEINRHALWMYRVKFTIKYVFKSSAVSRVCFHSSEEGTLPRRTCFSLPARRHTLLSPVTN